MVGTRESINGRKNIYATKKSKERREEPLETMSYQTSSKRSPQFWLLIGARKTQVFWHQSEARTAATVWNWSGKTLSPGALLAVLYFSSLHIYFSARLDFPSPPLSAPGSPRMSKVLSLDWFVTFTNLECTERKRQPKKTNVGLQASEAQRENSKSEREKTKETFFDGGTTSNSVAAVRKWDRLGFSRHMKTRL